MDSYNVYLTDIAEDDLRDIVRYISIQLQVPITGLRMLKTIRKAIEKLETNALAYPLVRDDRLARIGYRMLMIENYLAFYIVDEYNKTVCVDRILYARREWQNIL